MKGVNGYCLWHRKIFNTPLQSINTIKGNSVNAHRDMIEGAVDNYMSKLVFNINHRWGYSKHVQLVAWL